MLGIKSVLCESVVFQLTSRRIQISFQNPYLSRPLQQINRYVGNHILKNASKFQCFACVTDRKKESRLPIILELCFGVRFNLSRCCDDKTDNFRFNIVSFNFFCLQKLCRYFPKESVGTRSCFGKPDVHQNLSRAKNVICNRRLYNYFNYYSHVWKIGIASKTVRPCIKAPLQLYRYVIRRLILVFGVHLRIVFATIYTVRT